jgi:diacylglycerol O-acyltransferase / wax synthase
MDTLSAQDASFLHIETDRSQMHIGGVSLFEGPAPDYAAVRAMVLGKLDAVPRYRQRVRFPALGIGRPVWVDDPHFNIAYHLRHTALPDPGGDHELRALTGRVMSQALDRSKPLWEMWMVEGLEGGRWALMNKVHHCMVDGVSATDLLSVMLDAEPVEIDPTADEPSRWSAAPEPSGAQIFTHSLVDSLRPGEVVSGAVGAVRAPREAIAQAGRIGGALVANLGALRPVRSSLTGPVGPHRRWSWADADLAEVKAIRKGLGGTINDVVLAAIAGGFRELLLSRGEEVDGRGVRTMVPVSVRASDQRGEMNNRVSAVFADLPVGIADPAARLAAVTDQMSGLKGGSNAVAGEVLTSLSGFAPSMLLALGMRAVARGSTATFETATTNVPGPQIPLYAAGREMVASYPYVPIGAGVRVVVAIFSYNGALTFGVTGDYDAVPDIEVLSNGIETSMAELLATARDGRPAPAPA